MYKYLSFLFFCVVTNIYSQNDYSVEWFSADTKQLPQNSVKSVVQDKYGFIWMTTENGLVRFDGKSFQTFNLIPKNFENRMYSIEGNIASDSLFTFIDDNDFYILIHERNASLIKLNDGSNKKAKMTQLKSANLVRTAFVDREQLNHYKQFLYTKKNSLYEISTTEIKFYNTNKQLQFTKSGQFKILNFCLVNDQLMYIDSTFNAVRIDKLGNSLSSTLLPNQPKNSSEVYTNLAAQQLFIKANNSLFLLTEQNNQIATQKIFTSDILNNILLKSVYYDSKNEILYLGTYTDGLCVVKKKHFKTVKKTSTKSEYYYALDTIAPTTILTSMGLVLNENKVIDSITPLTKKGSIFNLIIDTNKKIWFAKDNKIYCLQNTKSTEPTDSIIFTDNVDLLFKGNNSIIWYTTKITNENHKNFGYFDSNNPKGTLKKFVFNKPINVLFQNNNTLWMGSNDGIYNYDLTTKKIIKIRQSDNLKPRSISKTSDNNIWVTTYGSGFYIFKNNVLNRIPSDKEKLLDHTHCIIEDQEGNLWMSTNNGIFAIKKQSIYQYLEKKSQKILYRYYDKKSGFLTNEFNGGCFPCGTKTADGTIVFPSMNGIVFFNPKDLNVSQTEYPFYIDKAIVDNKPVSFNDTIHLDRNFSRINFIVEKPFYNYSTANNLEAQLNTATSKEWLTLDDQNTITFTTLPPGNHKLLIRKFSNTQNKYLYKSIMIIVPFAYWETWWFQIVVAMLSIAIIFYGFKLRTNYIKNQNKQLELKVHERTTQLDQMIQTLLSTKKELKNRNDSQKKIINAITHDFRSPLRFLALVSKSLFENKNIKPEELKENLMHIHSSSNQLYEFVGNLVDYSKAFSPALSTENQSFNLHELIDEKIDLFKNIATFQKTTFHNNLPKHIIVHSNRLLVSIIIHNLLDNAVKSTNEGTVDIDWTNNHLEITDTGIGMPKEKVDYYNNLLTLKENQKQAESKGLGIKIVMNLIQILQAKITFNSKLNQGTTVKIQFSDTGKDLLS